MYQGRNAPALKVAVSRCAGPVFAVHRLGLQLPDSIVCVVSTVPVSAKCCRQPPGDMAPRIPVRIKEVIYTLSPFEQTVLSGLWKDLPAKMKRKWNEVSVCARKSPSCSFPSYSVTYTVGQHRWAAHRLFACSTGLTRRP